MKRTLTDTGAATSPTHPQISLDFDAAATMTADPDEASADPGSALDSGALLGLMAAWVDEGWLRALDLALARWLHAELPQSPPVLLLLVALLSQREGRGHGALRLSDLVRGLAPPLLALQTPPRPLPERADDWLAGPAAAQAALEASLQRLPADPAVWLAAVLASPAVTVRAPGEAPAPSDSVRTPFVFEQGLFYLRRHWRAEQAVASAVLARVRAGETATTPDRHADPQAARVWLDRLFGPWRAEGEAAEVDWQRVACAVALRGRLTLITGGPGTGKTYTVARLLALRFALHPDPQRLRIALAAPTGKAAARLKQSIDQALDDLRKALPDVLDWTLLGKRLAEALTLHKLLGARPDTRRLRFHAGHPLEVDLLVVDEASMVHLEMMQALLAALPEAAQLVLLGDRDQLASVEAGAVLGDLCGDGVPVADAATRAWVDACTGQSVPGGARPASPLSPQTVMLRVSRRFDGPIGALAQAVNAGDAAAARALLEAGAGAPASPIRWVAPATLDQVLQLALGRSDGMPACGREDTAAGADADGLLASLARLRERPPDSDAVAHEAWVRAVLQAYDRQRLLCALRDGDWGVNGVNRRIELALRERALIARSGEWYEGRPVMVTRNDAALGVFNGDVGVALRGAGAGAALRVWFQDGERLRSVLASRLSAVETAYAMTVHKSQGSEFAHTVLVLPPVLNSVLSRELVYTGITRARQRFTLVAPEPGVFEAAVRRRTVRVSGLAWRLGDAMPLEP